MKFRSIAVVFIVVAMLCSFTSCNFRKEVPLYYRTFWLPESRSLVCGDTIFSIPPKFEGISISKRLDCIITEHDTVTDTFYGIQKNKGWVGKSDFSNLALVNPPDEAIVSEKMSGSWGKFKTPRLQYFAKWIFGNGEDFHIWVYSAEIVNSKEHDKIVLSISTSLDGGLISWTTPTVYDSWSARRIRDICWFNYSSQTAGLTRFEDSLSFLDNSVSAFVHKKQRRPFCGVVSVSMSYPRTSVPFRDGYRIAVSTTKVKKREHDYKVYSIGLSPPYGVYKSSKKGSQYESDLDWTEMQTTLDALPNGSRFWPLDLTLTDTDGSTHPDPCADVLVIGNGRVFRSVLDHSEQFIEQPDENGSLVLTDSLSFARRYIDAGTLIAGTQGGSAAILSFNALDDDEESESKLFRIAECKWPKR